MFEIKYYCYYLHNKCTKIDKLIIRKKNFMYFEGEIIYSSALNETSRNIINQILIKSFTFYEIIFYYYNSALPQKKSIK
jgi:hypothetical protein